MGTRYLDLYVVKHRNGKNFINTLIQFKELEFFSIEKNENVYLLTYLVERELRIPFFRINYLLFNNLSISWGFGVLGFWGFGV